MPKSSKPRKKYNPAKRRVFTNAHEMAVESMNTLPEYGTYYTELKLKNHMAMYNLTHGQATRHDMDTLIAITNVLQALCEMKVCAPIKPEVDAAQEAVEAIVLRAVNVLAFRPTGPEMVALNTVMELHDELMEGITVKQMEQAIALAKRSIFSKRAVKLPLPKELKEATHG